MEDITEIKNNVKGKIDNQEKEISIKIKVFLVKYCFYKIIFKIIEN